MGLKIAIPDKDLSALQRTHPEKASRLCMESFATQNKILEFLIRILSQTRPVTLEEMQLRSVAPDDATWESYKEYVLQSGIGMQVVLGYLFNTLARAGKTGFQDVDKELDTFIERFFADAHTVSVENVKEDLAAERAEEERNRTAEEREAERAEFFKAAEQVVLHRDPGIGKRPAETHYVRETMSQIKQEKKKREAAEQKRRQKEAKEAPARAEAEARRQRKKDRETELEALSPGQRFVARLVAGFKGEFSAPEKKAAGEVTLTPLLVEKIKGAQFFLELKHARTGHRHAEHLLDMIGIDNIPDDKDVQQEIARRLRITPEKVSNYVWRERILKNGGGERSGGEA